LGDIDAVPNLQLAANSLTGQIAIVTIYSVIPGDSDSLTAYETPVLEVTNRIVNTWIMIFVSGTNIPTDLNAAKAVATWKMQIDSSVQMNDIKLPIAGVNGRYIRIQQETSEYLTLAEVQVFQVPSVPLSRYRGGSPIASATYQPLTSLKETFQGTNSRGEWLLVLNDKTLRESVTMKSLPSYEIHGNGAIDDWELFIFYADGSTTSYLPDISASVKQLPKYGTLYYYNAAGVANKRGVPVPLAVGMQRVLANCYNNCRYQWEVGNNLSTSDDGALAEVNNIPGERKVVYVPNSKWLGDDTITFTVIDGVNESIKEGIVTISTRKCRVTCVNDGFNDLKPYNR
jgi:hypothetical protein